MRAILLLIVCICCSNLAGAQFAPQAGVAGSTAISKTSSQFVGWAARCSINRGWMDIADQSLGSTTSGDSSLAIGPSNGTIVSLGDSGVATLTFDSPVYNGAGADFAVFENGFPNPLNPEEAFLELAFVEVSSDGQHFFRFPATSLTPEGPQIPVAGVYTNARNINNLAGKYIGGYGTPFDLDELVGTPGLDVNYITHIRLIDVIGSIGAHASLDKDGRKINDPYPTAIPTGGFDLDAVGAIYMLGRFPSAISNYQKSPLRVYPNPVTDRLVVSSQNDVRLVELSDITGKLLSSIQPSEKTSIIDMETYQPGMYFLSVYSSDNSKWVEKIIKR